MHNQASIKCLIVDDEPLARDVIRRHVEQIPLLELVGEMGNAVDASFYLQQNAVDLIFLDIKMPQLSGTDFVRSLRHVPKIIFTTAYKEYAIDGFDLDVVDYLLKPIRFDRFLKAVHKAIPNNHAHPQDVQETSRQNVKDNADFIFLKVDRKMVKVLIDEIAYIESDKDYVKVFRGSHYLISRQTISSIEAMLNQNNFVRIHRSYIVSLKKITAFSNDIVEVENKKLPIGKLYRNEFLKLQQG